ncbi:MAG: FAD-dependent thymidylate synthase [Candidatus Iainarchaeum sp.]|jgi:thymidylate synthase ThyX
MGKRVIRIIDDLVAEVANEQKLDLNLTSENMGEAHGLIVARLSQSPKPFKEIIKEIFDDNGLNKEKIIDFHKRITLGINHHSIEQHSYTSIGFENVSIIATNKYFENKRLAAYLERSTRYQDFSKPSYYIPKELNEEQKKKYVEAIETLFKTYQTILPKIEEEISRVYKEKGVIEKENNIKKKAFDSSRYLLPCSTYTNFAMSANSQVYRALITDLLSIENTELNESANELQKELEKIYPALVSKEVTKEDTGRKEHLNKNNKITPLKTNNQNEKIIVEEFEFENIQNTVKLINYTKNAEELMVYEYLVKEGYYPEMKNGKVILEEKEITEEEKKEIIAKLFEYNKIEEKPHRTAELANYYFETILDFGAGRDVHRNRMLTWIDSLVSPEYGYAVPYYLTKETKQQYEAALKKAYECWVELVKEGVSKEIAQYVLPLGTNYKVFYNINAKELHHVAKTRTTKHAHYSYREYVHQLVECAKQAQPLIANNIKDYYEKETAIL